MRIEEVPPQLSYHTDDSWWSLLRGDKGELYILVRCESSVASYERLIRLNDEELRDFVGLGWLSLQHLANRINYFSKEYMSRSITGQALANAQAAVGKGAQR